MNPFFVLQKSSNQKFYCPTGDVAHRVAVADMWNRPEFIAVEVVCDKCGLKIPAGGMRPTDGGPGLTCSGCYIPARVVENQETVLRKVRALLRLATSSNPNEAAAAASKAQEMIDRYRLNLASAEMSEAARIELEEPIEDFSRDPLNPGEKQLARWKGWLAMCIAEMNQCVAYLATGKGLSLVGRASDVATVRYLFTYVAGQIEQLAANRCKGCGLTYWNNFRLGATETVVSRLKAQKLATVEQVKTEALASSNAGALVVVEQSLALMDARKQEVERWAKTTLRLRARSSSGGRFNSSAREAGRAAGHQVSLTRNSGALGSGTRHLQ